VVELAERRQAEFRFVYDDALPLWEKMKAIATKIYGAAEITADSKVRKEIKQLQDGGYGQLPGVRRQDPVLVLDRRAAAGRAVRPLPSHPRGSARGGR